VDTLTCLRWKELDKRLEASRRERDIPEMRRILGVMTDLLHRDFGRPPRGREVALVTGSLGPPATIVDGRVEPGNDEHGSIGKTA